MAEIKKVKERIRDIAERKTNVTLSEIEAVLNLLNMHGFTIRSRDATHGKLFSIDSQRFMVCCHNPGSKHVKACYVRAFTKAMINLGLYDQD